MSHCQALLERHGGTRRPVASPCAAENVAGVAQALQGLAGDWLKGDAARVPGGAQKPGFQRSGTFPISGGKPFAAARTARWRPGGAVFWFCRLQVIEQRLLRGQAIGNSTLSKGSGRQRGDCRGQLAG